MRSSYTPYLGFNDKWFLLIGIVVIGASMPFIFFGHTLQDPIEVLAINWAISLTMSALYWFGSVEIIVFWRKRMADPQFVLRRIIFQLISILAYSFLIEKAVILIVGLLAPGEDEPHPVSGTAGTYLIILLIVSIYEAIFLYSEWRKALLEQERVKQDHLRSQLEGLRNQVNPHFLFNSLNTLMSIVQEDQDLAVSYLQKLSHVFRYVLENRDEQLISLSKELEFIDNYVFLQKERFRDNLVVNIDIPDEEKDKKVLPLALQILFENAIKHNVVSSKKPLHISVCMKENGKLEVRNNLQLKQQQLNSTNVGLQNIKDRYRFFTDDSVDILESPEYFSVSIPVLQLANHKEHELSHY